MPAAQTYEPIATTTLGSSAASYTFSSIPSTYTDLILISQVQQASGPYAMVYQLNGDTGSNYSSTTLWGNGSSSGSFRQVSETYLFAGYYSAPPTTAQGGNATYITQFMSYTNTSVKRSAISRGSSFANGVEEAALLWNNTAAINSITIKPSLTLGSFNTGCTFTLYGITAA